MPGARYGKAAGCGRRARGLPVLDSYFGDDERRESILSGLRSFLRTDPLTPPPILVTHTPNIEEVTGMQPDQGGMVVVRVTVEGDFETVGHIASPSESAKDRVREHDPDPH